MARLVKETTFTRSVGSEMEDDQPTFSLVCEAVFDDGEVATGSSKAVTAANWDQEKLEAEALAAATGVPLETKDEDA